MTEHNIENHSKGVDISLNQQIITLKSYFRVSTSGALV